MTESQGTRRAALYPRVSRSGKRDLAALERHTLSRQQAQALAVLPRSVDLVVDDRYRDVNVSGRTKADDRPGLAALFADLEAGVVHDVAVGYLSRFGRNTAELMANVARLDQLGATLYVGGDNPMTITPGTRGTSKLLLTILAAIDEMLADQLEDGLKAANATAIADGVSIQVPYGYRRSNGAGSPLEPDDDDTHGPSPRAIVQLIFNWRLTGMGASEIAAKLNANGVLTPTALAHEREQRDTPGAASWRHNTIKGIVETRTYKGVIPRATAWEGEGKQRRPIAWEELPAQHDALVDDASWKAAQITGPRATRNGSSAGSLLTGLVRCSSCSRTMRPSKSGTRTRPVLVYACPNSDCPRAARIVRAPVDALVVERLLHDASARMREGEQTRQELLDAQSDLRAIDEEYDTFASRAGAMPASRFARANADYLGRLEAAQRRVGELEAQVQTGVVERLLKFDDLAYETQRELLISLLDAVVVRPAPGRGQTGDVTERVTLIAKGTAPFELSGTGRVVAARAWPF